MKHIEKILAYTLLLFAVGWNLWLYKDEATIQMDPNDNAFQYALIDRTNEMWDYAKTVCPKTIVSPFCQLSILIDHWVPNWAQGYNLPYYYSHLPQITIVGLYRLIHPILPSSITLFSWYHICIYLLLSLLPLSFFFAMRILRLSFLTSGIAALFTSHISTDGLYGIDQSSFLWRGWGLSSQLFALLFFPLAISAIIRWSTTNKNSFLILSYLFLTLTTVGHLGIGMMAFFAVPVITFTKPLVQLLDKEKPSRYIEEAVLSLRKTLIITVPTILLLSYWIIPIVLGDAFHNISIWDPIWKFNSYGAKEVVTLFINGSLFDFGRFPLFTILIIIGLFTVFFTSYKELSLLFLLYLLLLFGKTTWGGLLTMIPGMKDFHQHRFIVGLHVIGLFILPIVVATITDFISALLKRYTKKYHTLVRMSLGIIITMAIFAATIKQTYSYASYNTTLIRQSNTKYQEEQTNFNALVQTLKQREKSRPGRVYALRATEGKDFKIASTPYYMALSTFGIPTVLWLPETWSMNSDTEQFFSEENETHYQLLNIAYVVTPPTKKPQPFWRKIQTTASWNLYEVETPGYIAVGTAPSIVYGDKTSFINLIHLWYQSVYPTSQIYPELRLKASSKPSTSSLPTFTMTSPISYKTPDGLVHSLMQDIPVYQNPDNAVFDPSRILIQSQLGQQDMIFSATVTVTKPCPTCIVYVKETSHPNWVVTVNGKRVQPIIVFPFYTAIRLETPGTYTVTFSYTPSRTKVILFCLGCISFCILFFLLTRKNKKGR